MLINDYYCINKLLSDYSFNFSNKEIIKYSSIIKAYNLVYLPTKALKDLNLFN